LTRSSAIVIKYTAFLADHIKNILDKFMTYSVELGFEYLDELEFIEERNSIVGSVVHVYISDLLE